MFGISYSNYAYGYSNLNNRPPVAINFSAGTISNSVLDNRPNIAIGTISNSVLDRPNVAIGYLAETMNNSIINNRQNIAIPDETMNNSKELLNKEIMILKQTIESDKDILIAKEKKINELLAILIEKDNEIELLKKLLIIII